MDNLLEIKNAILNSNLHSYYKLAMLRIHNWTHLVLNAFRRIKKALSSILCNSNKISKSSTSDSTEYQISPFQVLKSNKIHIRKTNLKVEGSEKIYSIESDYQNRTRSSIIERSISLEMNKTEFLSEGSE